MTSRRKVFSNFIWRFLERSGAQIVTFVVSIVLARLLDPVVYGTVALVTVITTILQVFVDSGLGNALIQKKNADDTDFSTVFYFNILVCAVLYMALFFAAPFIAKFYEMPELTPVIRVLGTILIISGVKNVQQAYVSKHLLFKRFFWATLGGTISAAVVGIWMAYKGYGVWALVAQYLVNAAMDTIILWITVKFRPKLLFSWKRLGGLFKYGWKLLVSALLDTGYNELRALIIGKKYSSEDLAFYNKGAQFPKVIATNINSSIDSVLLPVMSEEQDNRERVKMMTRRAIKTSSFILWPLMMGLVACAEPIVSLLLTDKWLPCVLFMRVFCITYAFYPIHTANLNAIKAMGRSDLFLILEIIKKAIGLGLILGFMWISVEAMAYSCIISSICSQIINSWPNKKLLKYSYIEQLKDILPSIGLSLFMAGCVYCIGFLHLNNWLTLLIQVPLGAIIYILGAKLFKFEAFGYLLSTAKGFFKKHKSSQNKTEIKKKKILLLGGSAQQVIAIETAKKLGYYTVLCDYLTDNPGQYVADKFYLVSTTDKEAVLKVAMDEKVDGVLAYASDPAAPTAAYVAEKLNLPGNPYESVEILCNKDKFRAFLTENGFNTPKAKGYDDIKEAQEDIENGFFKFPVIVKPVDSSGSKGVSKIESVNDVSEKLTYAISYSRSKRIIVEEYVEKYGYQIAGDGLSIDGKLVFRYFANDHFNPKCKNPFVPISASFPYNQPKEIQDKIHAEIQRLITLLGMKTCTYNFDMRIDNDFNVYLMEIAPRDGGNYIPQCIKYATGVDLVECSVKAAMGEKIDLTDKKDGQGFVTYYAVHSLADGTLDRVEIDEEIKKNNILEDHIIKKQGDEIRTFVGANSTLGILIMRFDNMEEMLEMMDNSERWIKVVLKQ